MVLQSPLLLEVASAEDVSPETSDTRRLAVYLEVRRLEVLTWLTPLDPKNRFDSSANWHDSSDGSRPRRVDCFEGKVSTNLCFPESSA